MKVIVNRYDKCYVSKVGVSLYCGHILESSCENIIGKKVYLISKDTPDYRIDCSIVGVLNEEYKDGVHFIVAKRGFVYYEPDIRVMLSRVPRQPISSLRCRYEKSCGAVIFHEDKNSRRILLIKNKNTSYWGFPKGHIERGETEYQTAIREVKEETGLNIKIIKGFRETNDYYSFGNVKKRVIFFLGETPTMNVKLQINELDSFKWLGYHDCLKTLRFKNSIIILKRAIYFLNGIRYKS